MIRQLKTEKTAADPSQVGPDGGRAPSPSQKKGGHAGKLQEVRAKPCEPMATFSRRSDPRGLHYATRAGLSAFIRFAT
jgi:hypothetical protein